MYMWHCTIKHSALLKFLITKKFEHAHYFSYNNHNNAYYGAKLLRLACNSYNIIFMVLAHAVDWNTRHHWLSIIIIIIIEMPCRNTDPNVFIKTLSCNKGMLALEAAIILPALPVPVGSTHHDIIKLHLRLHIEKWLAGQFIVEYRSVH